MELEEFFEHHGVKGMHWGIRNKRSRVTTAHPQTADSKKVAALKARKPHQLTNKQLKTVNERLNLETNFSKLNPTKIQKGHSYAKEILAITGTAGSIYALTKTSGGQKIVSVGKKYIAKAIAQGKLLDAAHLAKMAAIRGSKTSGQLALF